jgi:hypothetical protein
MRRRLTIISFAPSSLVAFARTHRWILFLVLLPLYLVLRIAWPKRFCIARLASISGVDFNGAVKIASPLVSIKIDEALCDELDYRS